MEMYPNTTYYRYPGFLKICFLLFLFTLEDIHASNQVINNSVISSKALKSCKVPDNKSTQYKSTPCEQHNYCGLVSGKIVAGNGTMVTLKCADSYMPRNENVDFIVCYDGVWYPKQHTCLKACKALNYKSIDANCTYKGEPVACNRNIRIGTQVQWKCKSGYETGHSNRNNTCLKSGSWKSPISECYRVTCDGLKLKTIEANCSHGGEPVDCRSHVKIGTQLQWKCKPGFLSKNSNRHNICLRFGVWQSVMAECIPENKPASAKLNPRRFNGVAKVGSIVELNCHVGGYPNPTVTWLKNGEPVRFTKRVSNNIATVESSDLRFPTRVIYALYFDGCVVEDIGTYECRVENSHSTASDYADMLVYNEGMLSINKTMEKRIVSVVGSQVNIVCNIRADPVPITVRWFKSNEQLLPTDRINVADVNCISSCTGRLVCPAGSGIAYYGNCTDHSCTSQVIIENAQESDSGNYKCEALNDIASDQRFVDLIVNARRPKMRIDPPSGTTIRRGWDVTLTCNVEGSSKADVKWLFNNVSISAKYPNEMQISSIVGEEMIFTFRIREAQPSDSGIYTCQAVTKLGEKNEVSTSISVPFQQYSYDVQRGRIGS
ncbi:contactin-4 isoform X2 [Nilaparvata lugens]|uniref:contactin-4 isoform X2 n=2 Tax=Nilaparvata lugens TaxID=108931 RepID=UPI00193CBA40|nr:contactin-4 isoform X2 [Nilaparvata lugens]